MELDQVRFYGAKFFLEAHSLVYLTGSDTVSFVQAYGTNDFLQLSDNEAQLNCRLDVAGKVQGFFYSAKLKDKVLLLVPSEIVSKLVDNLNKYIIMEDVQVDVVEEKVYGVLSPFIREISEKLSQKEQFFKSPYLGEEALFFWGENEELYEALNLPTLEPEACKLLMSLSAWPAWGGDLDQRLVNETVLDQLAVSYEKGCFLGQETAAKVHHNRGAAYFPCLLRLDASIPMFEKLMTKQFSIDGKKAGTIKKYFSFNNKDYLFIELLRDHRVSGQKLSLTCEGQVYDGLVVELPFFKSHTRSANARELYKKAVENFQKENLNLAIEQLEHCLELDGTYADAYEILGVIKGKKGLYQDGIELMDRLLQVDPISIMAHTNKSLFFMNLGKIEEAEQEKALATAKSFEMSSKKAVDNDLRLKELEEKERLMEKREKMFLQVLEIDGSDSLANIGMGEICFYRKNYLQTVKYMEKVLDVEPKNSIAYLLLGKALEADGNVERAKKVYDKGIAIASSMGQHKHANEMRTRLNKA